MTRFKLGKRPAHRLLKAPLLSRQIALPAAPTVFGHADLVKDWGMLANDQVGDCAVAGPCHQLMLACAKADVACPFDALDALLTYSAISGYDPRKADAQGNNPTDTGCDMADVAEYLIKTGFRNSAGVLLKIGAFAQVNPRNLAHLASAAWLFDGVQLGVQLPESAQDQFAAGDPWTVTDAEIEGGHDIFLAGRAANGNFLCVSWGGLAEVTPEFVRVYGDEAVAYLLTEDLINGKTPEGQTWAQRVAELRAA